VFVDARAKKVIGTVDLPNPRGLAFGIGERKVLYALSGRKLLRFDFANGMPASDKIMLPQPENLIPETADPSSKVGLEDPRQLTLDPAGEIYISDRGASHQVKVFSANGKFQQAIGMPGLPLANWNCPTVTDRPAHRSNRTMSWAENTFLRTTIAIRQAERWIS
jgi:hypothetical protein